MASKPFHLVERAAERLRQEGLLDGVPLGPPPPLERPELAGTVADRAVADAVRADALRAEPRPARPVVEAAQLEAAGMVSWSRTRSRVSRRSACCRASCCARPSPLPTAGRCRSIW